MTSDALDELLQRLPAWDRFFSHLQTPSLFSTGDREVVREITLRLVNLRRRLRDGPQAPLRLAFFGPTGSGKSKLFSSLIGQDVSGSGYKRPHTRRAVYYLHAGWRAIAANLAGDVHFHEDDLWQHTLLIDTPDFDSVEADNRIEAERVFMESDAFLFVTDSLKYADAATWEYLTRIKASQKRFGVILNKVNSPAILEGFAERFQATFGEPLGVPQLVVAELRLQDNQLIAADSQAMQTLRKMAVELSTQTGPETSALMFQQEATGIVQHARQLQQRTQQLQHQFGIFASRIPDRCREANERLEVKLTVGIGPEVRDEVYQKVLKRLERIDILRYPRKLLALPFRGLKIMFSGWLPGPKAEADLPPERADPITSETFQLLEAEIIRVADDLRLDWVTQPKIAPLLTREAFQSLRMSHEDVQLRFAEHHQKFKEWLAIHARETAAEITTENKAKFFVSQVLFNTLLITAQVHTGGALSFVELGMDGVISPFVAKAVGMAIGKEKVRKFEQTARQYHRDSLSRIIQEAGDRFLEFLQQQRQDVDELAETAMQIVAYEREFNRLIDQFQVQATQVTGPKPA